MLVRGIDRQQSDIATPGACFRVHASEEETGIVTQQKKSALMEKTANPGKIDAVAVDEGPLGTKAKIDEIANCFSIRRACRAGFEHEAIVGEGSSACYCDRKTRQGRA